MSVISTESMEVAVRSDCGRVRSGNEDASGYDLSLGIFVVCDGMGGAAAGEVASQLAVQTILEHWRKTDQEDARKSADKKQSADKKSTAEENISEPNAASALDASEVRNRLRAAIQEANTRILRRAEKDARMQGMGTTAVVLYAEPNETGATVWLAHAGDSRCYRWRAGDLRQMTLDHSLVEEQVRLGHMTLQQAEHSPFRNVITRAVGAAPTVEADVFRDDARHGDIYLLCSDGLTRELHEARIASIIATHAAASSPATQTPMDAACAELITAANEHGGRDNITCILVRIG